MSEAAPSSLSLPPPVDVHSRQDADQHRTDHSPELKERNTRELASLDDRTVLFPPNDTLSRLVSVVAGNIADLDVDAIVNAANETLLGGGGVDEAIHRRAGPGLLSECRALPADPRTGYRCEVGEAKLTHGHALPARYVIHTVAPLLDDAGREQPHLLRRCYESCLRYLDGARIRSIAFCALGTGFYGYPQVAAARMALECVRRYLDARPDVAARLDRVVFCTFGAQQTELYQRLLPCYFPTG